MKRKPIVALFLVPASLSAVSGGIVIDKAVWLLSPNHGFGGSIFLYAVAWLFFGLAAMVLPVVAVIGEGHDVVHRETDIVPVGVQSNAQSQLEQVAVTPLNNGLDQLLKRLDKIDLLIVDELGYLSFNRSGAELLFQVFADRYERRSLLITSNLSFSDWGQIFQGERITAALLDRLTHHCHIFEMNGESFRFKESMKEKKKPGKQA